MEGKSEPDQYLKRRSLKLFPSLLCSPTFARDTTAMYNMEQKFNRGQEKRKKNKTREEEIKPDYKRYEDKIFFFTM